MLLAFWPCAWQAFLEVQNTEGKPEVEKCNQRNVKVQWTTGSYRHWFAAIVLSEKCAQSTMQSYLRTPWASLYFVTIMWHTHTHTDTHTKVKGNLQSEVLLSSFVKDPSCPLIFRNVPLGMKTSDKTYVGLIVHLCIERERLSWDTRW